MKQNDRFEKIIELIQKYKSVKVSDLSKLLNVSEVTIRNDIRILDEDGIIKRVHGGATIKEDGLTVTFPAGEFLFNAEDKIKISQKAYELILDNDSIIIDDSTTGCHLARLIADGNKMLTVVTNSLFVASLLSTKDHISLIVIGGQTLGTPPSMLDAFAINAFRSFNVDKAFIGVNGINLKSGLTSIGKSQMETKKAIIDSASKTIVLADHTKFNNRNLFIVYPLSKIDLIITDDKITKDVLKTSKELGIKLTVV